MYFTVTYEVISCKHLHMLCDLVCLFLQPHCLLTYSCLLASCLPESAYCRDKKPFSAIATWLQGALLFIVPRLTLMVRCQSKCYTHTLSLSLSMSILKWEAHGSARPALVLCVAPSPTCWLSCWLPAVSCLTHHTYSVNPLMNN